VASTIEALRNGTASVDDIPIIRVVRREGKLLTLDHRRLYSFQKALPADAQVPMRLLVADCPL